MEAHRPCCRERILVSLSLADHYAQSRHASGGQHHFNAERILGVSSGHAFASAALLCLDNSPDVPTRQGKTSG